MLVLSRKTGQEIVVGDSVRITVTKVSGNRVTLGVEAPDDVRILRGELEPIARSFEEIDEEEEVPPPSQGPVALTVHDSLCEEPGTIPFSPNAAR